MYFLHIILLRDLTINIVLTELLHGLWNPEVHFRTRECSPLFRTLKRIHLNSHFHTYLFEVYLKVASYL